MGVNYARSLKPGYANELEAIIEISNQVRRVIAGIAHEDPTSEEFLKEVKIQMQPRPDGGLAIIGWINREPVPGIPDERFNEEIEIVPDLPPPPARNEQPESIVKSDNVSPFLPR
jgi:hypothetical protein